MTEHKLTKEQKEILRQQVQQVRGARRKAALEESLLHQMLVLVDPRFADPKSGVVFDPDTLEIQSQRNETEEESALPETE